MQTRPASTKSHRKEGTLETVAEKAKEVLERLSIISRGGEWSIGIYRGDHPTRLHEPGRPKNPILTRHHVADARAAYVADPFLVRHSANWILFFEILNADRMIGEIAHAVSFDGKSWNYAGRVLAEPFHLSYPLVFAHEGDWYMVPESSAIGEVRLYRAEVFPTRWAPVRTLLSGKPFSDTTIHSHGNRWWLFSDASDHKKSDTLCLYSSSALHGPYLEHPQSPIVRDDPTAARPAGRLVSTNDGIIRFAQICRPHYGAGVNAFMIARLTPDEYQEQSDPLGQVLTARRRGWNGSGMHHIDAHLLPCGDWFAAVDGMSSGSMNRPRPPRLLRRRVQKATRSRHGAPQ